ncbi:ATP-grasp fold amidoligase family protein [Vagococcus bubulae]|uniref:Glycosyl transferase n=1 Tax=Vagococcus bubulae TaxID=1977868 RepID=A0A429ZIQ8_9ENTE|nr:ATP-grasp fold amidoligase family protein [Vagococcus bubulae]RST93572.1 hypothetical protein CBF36_07035 [Vagococcus bubulae]
MGILKTINYHILSDISPTFATRLIYFRIFKRRLNLNPPHTLNEKIQWLKLNEYGNNELVTKCTDKLLVRDYVQRIDGNLLNELLFIYDDVDEIEWEKLPEKFVIKMNHGSGFNLICSDINNFDIGYAKEKLKLWKNEDFWKIYSELQYKHIKKKILIEKYIETQSGKLPNDYKIFCFHGKALCIMSCEERETGNTKFYYFNVKGELVPYNKSSVEAIENNLPIHLPENYEDMVAISEALSKPFKFVRVDLYSEDNQIIFGELTFTPGAGINKDRFEEIDLLLGKQLDLSK